MGRGGWIVPKWARCAPWLRQAQPERMGGAVGLFVSPRYKSRARSRSAPQVLLHARQRDHQRDRRGRHHRQQDEIDVVPERGIKQPIIEQFDVIATVNIFGDILSDQASMLTGSIGMLPSASLNDTGKGLYEPSHGSAPDIAGQNKANPLATILSLAMLLRYSLNDEARATQVEQAVQKVLQQGLRTGDIFEQGTTLVSCSDMGDAVIANL